MKITTLNYPDKRAQSFAQYLLDAGIDPKRLTVNAYGESQLVNLDNDELTNIQNRRVEVVLDIVEVE